MKKKFFFFFFLSTLFSFAQEKSDNLYWIEFKDKNGSVYSVSEPSLYLSDKAIERRQKQNIPFTTNDLPVNATYVKKIKAVGVEVVNQSKWFNAITITTSDTGKINLISTLPFVKAVKQISGIQNNKVPSKFEVKSITYPIPLKSDVSGGGDALQYGPSLYQVQQIKVDCLHDLGYKGENITIAVLDAGFYKVDSLHAFDSLRLNNQILGTRDFVAGGTMVYEDFLHGMNTLSCMGGNLPGRLVGTAPKSKYWLLRTEDIGSETVSEEINWAIAAEFADSVGVDLISSSLGYNYFDNSADNYFYSDLDGNTSIITRAADIAASKGIFVVSSAGNKAGLPWYKITPPADADSILTVGAVDSAGDIGSFSSRGLTFDGRIKPNTVALGVQAITASEFGDIIGQNGTSFSSPITAGAVACLWQAHPDKTNMELLKAIEKSSSQYSTPDSIKGYGIPDFCNAHSILTGITENSIDNELITIYPNPFNSGFEIRFNSYTKQSALIKLYDLSGREMLRENIILNPNNNVFKLNEDGILSPGIYILELSTTKKKYFKKLVKN